MSGTEDAGGGEENVDGSAGARGDLEQLIRENRHLRNLLENSNVAVLFVDSDLAVRDYTPRLARIFALSETDKGRPIGDIPHNLDDDSLVGDLADVLQRAREVEREVAARDGSGFYTLRIAPFHTVEDRIDGAVLTFSDVTRIKDSEHRLEESERRQRMLLRELQHRVKNILANVRGLARQTLPESGTVDEFYEAFEGRLEALGRAQGLLHFGADGYIALTDLVLEELLAHTAQPSDTLDIGGPNLLLEPRAAQTFGLTIHELATNAVKFGALSDDSAHLSVQWSVEIRGDEPYLILQWRETGLNLDPDQGRSGFGRRLIEQAAPYELGGTCQLEFPTDGCRCVMEIPFDDRIVHGEELELQDGELG